MADESKKLATFDPHGCFELADELLRGISGGSTVAELSAPTGIVEANEGCLNVPCQPNVVCSIDVGCSLLNSTCPKNERCSNTFC